MDKEIIYNHKTKRLTILENGKPVAGFIGKIATRLMVKITKIEFNDGNIQVGIH